MGEPQKRAVAKDESRLGARSLTRFEVLGRDRDRALIRRLAKKLAEDSPDAERLRAVVAGSISGEPPTTGGIAAALLASPLAGSGLAFGRDSGGGRKVDLG
ncbi:hypothetical protein ABTU92_08620 [Rhodoplanes sp. SY1]